ncbi:SPOC domain-like protein [Phellopilus nigrolimitatus]|nr:SPOC domain-like protein [Phellopilus nigrolimitatus]
MPAERAGYTVTMFLIDVSPSMAKLRTVEIQDGPQGETSSVEMTNLQWSLQFVLLKIQEMIYHGRKTEQCGVVLFGTEGTDNIISNRSGGYDNVTEFIPIAQPNAATLAKIQALQPSTVNGDPVDAIIVGIETQDKYLGKKKTWTRRMVLLTDGENPIEVEDWELTVKKMNDLQIITSIIGIDFDDEEFGFEEEDKSNIKRENEKFYHRFASSLKEDYGIVGTAAFALQECVRPDVKMTKSALIGTTLRLGDIDVRAEEAVELPVKMSKCTALVRPASMKKFAKRVETAEEQTLRDVDDDESRKDVYAQLAMQTEYFVSKDENADDEKDEDEDEGKQGEDGAEKVDKEQLIRGFKYGASYAPCPDGQFPRLSTRKGIDICGFFSDKMVRRNLAMGEVQYVWADPSSGQTQVSFSSIVQAMLARGVVAIARWVSRDEMDPKMGLLIPREFEKVDCFLWLQMPFADDVRRYTFPSLENLFSKKGEVITKHPFIPTDEQMGAMDHFVDSMDLMQAGDKNEEGNREPWFDPRLSYNPAVHRIKQALFHAAVVTDLRTNPLPPPHPEVVKYLEPPRRVLKRAHDATVECKSVFKIKQVPKKVTRQRKDGHVRAEDDDDELLLLDQPSKSSLSKSASQIQSQESGNGNGEIKEKMDVDSETEPEFGDEAAPTARNGKADSVHLPTPQPSVTFVSQSQSASQDLSQAMELDDGRAQDRIVGVAYPLVDFKKGVKNGNLVKATEDLGFVIMDLIMKPFASRRKSEFIECMREMRSACLKEGENDAWNAFLRELKDVCVGSGVGNKGFWDIISDIGREISLIGESEAKKLGSSSDVSDSEAEKFIES